MSPARAELYQLIHQVSPNKLGKAKKLLISVISKDDIPRSTAMPRPNGEPLYIHKNCPACGTRLVYEYLVNSPYCPENNRWYDEFACPVCNDGIYLDCPPDDSDGGCTAEDLLRQILDGQKRLSEDISAIKERLSNLLNKNGASKFATEEDIAALNAKCDVLNSRLFNQEAELYKLKAVE